MGFSRWSSLLLAALALSPAAHAQSTYRLTRIDAGVRVALVDMNEKGEMVGLDFSGGPSSRAVLLRDGMLIDLGAGSPSLPSAINDLTQIAGTNSISRAFLWESGQIRDLGVDASLSGARDINNRGQIVGQGVDVIDNAVQFRAFLWEQGRTTFLEAFVCPPSQGRRNAVANAINENGVVVGTSFGSALIWQNGEVMTLAPPFPMDLGESVDVNDQNEAIGFYAKACCSDRDPISSGNHCCNSATHTALLWQPEGEVTALPLLDRSPDPERLAPLRSFPESINDAGQVVGWTTFVDTDTNEEQVVLGGGFLALATLWQDGSVFDLNELVRDDDPAKPFVRLMIGLKITDSGLILVQGQDTREAEEPFPDHFLLTPDGTLPATAPAAPPSSPSPSASDSGGGAVDLFSLLLLIFGLATVAWHAARLQHARRAKPFD